MSRFLTFSPGVGPDVAIRDGRVHVVFGHQPWTWLQLDFEGTLFERRQQACGYYPKTNGRVSMAHDGLQFVEWELADGDTLLSYPPGKPLGVHAAGISPNGRRFFSTELGYLCEGVKLPNPWASYGLWECCDDGTCRTWDECFYSNRPPGCAGQTHHAIGANLTVSEGETGVCGWLNGHQFVLWPGQETLWPRVATDGAHAAIVCWDYAGPTVKVWIGMLAELAALPLPGVQPHEIAPFAEHFWAWCYKDLTSIGPENVATLGNGSMVAGGKQVGWNLAIETRLADVTRTALACKSDQNVPVYAYMGGYVPETPVEGVDFPVIQAYRLAGCETAAAILAKLRADLARCCYPRVALAIDLTARTLADGVPWSEQDRITFLCGIAELCRQIRPAAVFAWAWNRAVPQAGISSSPVIAEQWRRFVAAIPPAPPIIVAPETPKPPETPETPEDPPMQSYNELHVAEFCATVRATYREAKREPDDMYPIWSARAVYDYCAGLSWDASCAKHLIELRSAFGLSVSPS